MGDRNVYGLNQAGRGSEAGARKVFGVRSAAVLTTDTAINRTIGLCTAPANFVVTGFTLVMPDVDSNGTPLHAFVLGDAALNNRLATTATTGQAGGTLTTLAATGLYFKYLADTEIILTTTVASATAQASANGLTFQLEGYME
jgi:hypothetical protein